MHNSWRVSITNMNVFFAVLLSRGSIEECPYTVERICYRGIMCNDKNGFGDGQKTSGLKRLRRESFLKN